MKSPETPQNQPKRKLSIKDKLRLMKAVEERNKQQWEEFKRNNKK